jgi:translation elongation factor EF-1alpha
MSEFDKLKDEAEKEMKEHPEQVKEGQQAVEKSSPGPPVRTGATRAMRRKATRPASRRAGNTTAQGRRAPL